MLLPVFVQDKQQLLSPPCRKHRQQTLPLSFHDLVHVLLKFLLAHASALMHPNSKCALGDQDINIRLRNLSFHNVAIFLATVISRVENLNPVYFDDEHRCPHNMPSHIGRYLDAFFLSLNPKFNGYYSFKTVENLLCVEECALFLNFSGIPDQIMIDIFCRFGHVDLFFVFELGEEVGESATMV